MEEHTDKLQKILHSGNVFINSMNKLSKRNPLINHFNSTSHTTSAGSCNTSTTLATTGLLSSNISSSLPDAASVSHDRTYHHHHLLHLHQRNTTTSSGSASTNVNHCSMLDPRLSHMVTLNPHNAASDDCRAVVDDKDFMHNDRRLQDSSRFPAETHMNAENDNLQYYGSRRPQRQLHRQYSRRRMRSQDLHMFKINDQDPAGQDHADTLKTKDVDRNSPILLTRTATGDRMQQCNGDFSDKSSIQWSTTFRPGYGGHTARRESHNIAGPRRHLKLPSSKSNALDQYSTFAVDQTCSRGDQKDLAGTHLLISSLRERHCAELPTISYCNAEQENEESTLGCTPYSSNGDLRPWLHLASKDIDDDDLLTYSSVSTTGCFPITKLLLPSRSSNKKLPKLRTKTLEMASTCSDSDLETTPLVLMTEAESSINGAASTPWQDSAGDQYPHLREITNVTRANPARNSGQQLLSSKHKCGTKPQKPSHQLGFDSSTGNENMKPNLYYSQSLTSTTSMSELDIVEAACHLRNNNIINRNNIPSKHKPRAFKDLVGQNLVVQSLSNCAMRGKVAPAYLFQGPKGTGKTCAARVFAASLCCQSANPKVIRPCGCCAQCSSVYGYGTHNVMYLDDVREMNAHGNSGAESVKRLLQEIHLTPSSSRYRILIIDDCHLLTLDAWNLLLKHLENPPSYAVFIFITSNHQALPHKVQSHCQKFLFSKIKTADILSRLQNIAVQEDMHIDIDALQLIACRSDGSLRDAVMLLDQVCLLGNHVDVYLVQELLGHIPEKKLVDLLDHALSPDAKGTVNFIRELLKSGIDPLALTSQLAVLITDILSGKNKLAEFRFKHVRKMESVVFQNALRILSDTEKQLRSCDDRSTWLIAALLQFSQIDLVSSAPLSKSQLSNDVALNQTDSSEESILGSHVYAQQANIHDRASFVGGNHQRLDLPNKFGKSTSGDSFSTVMDEERSEHKSMQHSNSGNPINQIQLGAMGSCSMDNIWKKILESIRSNVIKQLLRSEAKFISLSVTEDVTVAWLEFKHPEYKALAEKVQSSIEKAFAETLLCPIVVKITLSSPEIRNQFQMPIGPTSCKKTQQRKPKSCKSIKNFHGTHKKLPLYYSSPPSAPEYNYTYSAAFNDECCVNQKHEEYCGRNFMALYEQDDVEQGQSDMSSIAQLDKLLQVATIESEAENAVIHNHKCRSDSMYSQEEGSGAARKQEIKKTYKNVVKHDQNTKMKKRGRTLLRLVPCAKASLE